MYLKTLELYGFKSFPDKTVLSFTPGMTAIVGANGSGKSNISDAIRFVLGEMSAKTLRGGKLEDVIFGGTATRKSANFAEVTMTIDNSDHRLRYDGDEVSVTRRLYRDGTSEYKLCGESARLKDVVETFLDTGIGREGYSVIGQGKISEILSAKGSDRRDVFEEAAGISKFRYRKNEAQSKLVGVSENAVRIGDILAEVEDRLPALEQQARRAGEYRALADERRALEIALFCEQLSQSEEETEALESELAAENDTYRAFCDRCEVIERELERLYLENQQGNVEAETLRGAISEAAGEQSELYSTLSVLENDIHHHEASIRQAQDSIAAFEADRAAAEQALAAAEQAARQAEDGAREQNARLVHLRERIAADESALAAAEEAAAALEQEKERLTEALHHRELAAREAEVLLTASRARIAAATERIEQLRDTEKTARATVGAAEQARAERQAEVSAAEEALRQMRERLDRLGRTALTIERRIAAYAEKRAVLEEKRAALIRMRRTFEGYPDSVRAVMSAAEHGRLSGIYGPVSSLFSTDDAYTVALETALGAAAGHIVVKNRDAARAAIRYLKEERLGRATFLPLDTLDRRADAMTDLPARGFLGNALSLVRFDKTYLAAAEYLLGRCAVAEDLECATAIAQSRRFQLKTVTLDGQIIHAGGAFAGGSREDSARLLSRERDLQTLDEELSAAERSIAEARGELDDLHREENALAAEQSRLREALEEAQRALFDTAGAVQGAQERLLAVQESVAQAEAERDALTAQPEQSEQEERAALTGALERAADALVENAGERERLAAELRTLRAEAQTLSETLSEAVSEAARKSAHLEALTGEQNARLSAIDNLKEQIRALGQTVCEIRERIRADAERKDAMVSSGAQMNEKLEAIKLRLTEIEAETMRLRNEQKEAITRREAALGEIQLKAARLERMRHERAAYLSRLAEEYELDEAALRNMKIEPGTAKALGGKGRLSKLRSELRALGPVNEEAPEEFAALSERHAFLRAQYDDVTASKEGLENLIVSLEKTMREMFLSTFEKLREIFREIFREFFGGGNADIILTDRDDLLNCFIEVTVQPPGKNVKNLSLLSGGEQAFVAIALYLSLLRVNPTPFCIFDEIESALDESNVARFAEYLHRQSKKTQFLLITHRRGTMDRADALYGITMQEKGVSDFIRLAEDEIREEYEQK